MSFHWDKPLGSEDYEIWRAGSVPSIRIRFRMSTDQNCTLTLYRRVYAKFDRPPEAVIGDNLEELQQPNRWKVSSDILHPNRVGLLRFGYIPLGTFVKLWRKPINPREDFAIINGKLRSTWSNPEHFRGKSHPLALSIGDHYKIEPFVNWPGIFEIKSAPRTAVGRQYFCEVKKEFRHWLCNDTKGNIYPFSDCESTFENKEDEWIYLTDYGLDGA